MIPAVRLGATLYRLGLEQLVRSPAVVALKPGSEWIELMTQAGARDPERWGEPPFHDPRWWEGDPRGFVVRHLDRAFQRHQHLERVARNLTPEQATALWQDPSDEAAALRRVVRGA